MKPAVATLAILTAGALSLAFADPPANPVGPGPAVAPALPAPSASAEREQERLLRNQGYKLRMVHGEEKYCRREIPLGSHLATVMHCVTVAEAGAMAREGREVTEHIQRSTSGCLLPWLGGCGH